MSLFGEKCVRCGKRRTKETYEGLPTCEVCEADLQASARAASEGKQKCPVDGTSMSKDVVLNIVIDRCPSCNGVWLDGGELELIRSAVANGVAMDLARVMPLPF
jgi:Zn-finger nucleic acid-binding protein